MPTNNKVHALERHVQIIHYARLLATIRSVPDTPRPRGRSVDCSALALRCSAAASASSHSARRVATAPVKSSFRRAVKIEHANAATSASFVGSPDAARTTQALSDRSFSDSHRRNCGAKGWRGGGICPPHGPSEVPTSRSKFRQAKVAEAEHID